MKREKIVFRGYTTTSKAALKRACVDQRSNASYILPQGEPGMVLVNL